MTHIISFSQPASLKEMQIKHFQSVTEVILQPQPAALLTRLERTCVAWFWLIKGDVGTHAAW